MAKTRTERRRDDPNPPLPSNIEAEQFVLGSILLDDKHAFPQAEALREADFSIQKHWRIFTVMRELFEAGVPVEYITVADVLGGNGHLEVCGGVAYVSSLTDGMPRLGSIATYVEIVLEKSRLRRLWTISEELRTAALEGGKSSEIIDSSLERLIETAPAVAGGAKSINEAVSEPGVYDGLVNPSSGDKGVETGIYELDELTNGLHGGELVVIGARTSMGKTAFALGIAAHYCAQGGSVLIFSLEMTRLALIHRILCAEARVNSQNFRKGFLTKEQRRPVNAALTEIMKWKLYIDEQSSHDIGEILSISRRERAQHQIDLIIVDYLQLVHARNKQDNRVAEITAVTHGLKKLARDQDIPVIALSQLNRSLERRGGGDKRPQLSDLRESGSIEEDADVVVFIYREEIYKPGRPDLAGKAELIVSKQRNGPTGIVHATFLKDYARFANLEGFRAE